MDAGQFIIASALTAIAVLLMTTLHPKASWTYHLLLLWDTSAVSFALLALGLTLLRSNADIPPVTSHNLLFSAVLMGLMDIGYAVLFFALKLLKSRGLSDIAAVEEALIKPGVSGSPRLVLHPDARRAGIYRSVVCDGGAAEGRGLAAGCHWRNGAARGCRDGRGVFGRE
jgi:hypothetical protein